ncbi:hypothetical protein Q1695_010168 [Nippostrongylus brasiliensis]|nr:hypothetical protein Q1695_010168 [Nippostrongylus brasiliensis]
MPMHFNWLWGEFPRSAAAALLPSNFIHVVPELFMVFLLPVLPEKMSRYDRRRALMSQMISWQWLATAGSVACVGMILVLCCVVLCRRGTSSYEVSKAVMNQQAPQGRNEFYV